MSRKPDCRELEKRANAILRRNGFSATGEPRRRVVMQQVVFERLLISTPSNGSNGYRLHKRKR